MYLEKGKEEELLCYMRQGCPYAMEMIYEYLETCIDRMLYKAASFSISDADREDIKQQLLVVCLDAVDSYRNDESCSFRTFITIVIRKRMYKLLKDVSAYNLCLLAEPYDDKAIIEQEEQRYYYQPHTVMVVEDTKEKYFTKLNHLVSSCDQDIYRYHYEGYSVNEISEMLQVNAKKVTNSIYRTRVKLKK